MRWSIRYQFLVPLALLLLGLAGVCAWTAVDSARAAERRIATQMNGIIRTLGDARYPLTQPVLEQLKGYSGADYLLLDVSGQRVATFGGPVGELPAALPVIAAAELSLGERIEVADRAYLCRGIVLPPTHVNAGARLYIF